MDKWWIDGEDGHEALNAVRDHPESLHVISEQGRKKLREMELRVLGISVNDASKDREMLIERAKMEGARLMLNSFIELLTKSNQSKPGKDK